MGFSIINQPLLGTPIYGNPHVLCHGKWLSRKAAHRACWFFTSQIMTLLSSSHAMLLCGPGLAQELSKNWWNNCEPAWCEASSKILIKTAADSSMSSVPPATIRPSGWKLMQGKADSRSWPSALLHCLLCQPCDATMKNCKEHTLKLLDFPICDHISGLWWPKWVNFNSHTCTVPESSLLISSTWINPG